MPRPNVAVLRPDDGRIDEAVRYLKSIGVSPVPDPMVTIRPTGEHPRRADYCIFTSKTGVALAADRGWNPDGETVCAVGPRTAEALRNRGYTVDITPSKFTSTGLVEALAEFVEDATVEIARSAHGSNVLIRGLEAAGATVHETPLYRLERPNSAGTSVALALSGDLDGVLFTAPKTVEHFFDIVRDREQSSSLERAFDDVIVGAIGTPTERTLIGEGVTVDAKPDTVGFDQLAESVVRAIDEE